MSEYLVEFFAKTTRSTTKLQAREYLAGIRLFATSSGRGASCPMMADKIDCKLGSVFDSVESSCRAEVTVMQLKQHKTTNALPQAKKSTLCLFDHADHLGHYLLHQRPGPTMLWDLAHRGVDTTEILLHNQTQQVHRHCSELVHKIVGIEIAGGSSLQIHIGLEVRVKLLMGSVIALQRNDLSGIKIYMQCCQPAIEYVLWKKQNDTRLLNGALRQTVDTAHWGGLTADLGLLPNAFTLALAMNRRLRADIGSLLRRISIHQCHVRRHLCLRSGYLHQLQRAKTIISLKLQWRRNKSCAKMNVRHKVVFVLGSRILHIAAHVQFQVIAQTDLQSRKQEVSIHSGIISPHQCDIGDDLAPSERVQVTRGVVARQSIKINRLAIGATDQQTLVNFEYQIKLGKIVSIQTLAQGGICRNGAQTQGTNIEEIIAKILDSFKVAPAQAQQARVGFKDVAVGDSRVHRKIRIDHQIILMSA